MSEHAGDSSGGAATAVSTDPVPLISTLTDTTTLAAAAEVTVDALATSTSGPSGTVAEHWPALRPANTSRADAWARLREACPWYFAPLPVVDNIPEMDPAPVAPPAPDRELEAEKIESFEEWKRRKEAEDAPAPHADEVPAPAENKSADAGAAPHVLENNTAPESAPPPPAAPKLTGGHRYNYNYASPDCSARVLSSSPLTQHASSLLHKSRDRYMLTPCRADEHWVVVELCDEIRVEAIELAVWEFFSGIVRGVTVSVGDDATGASWTQVGEFVGKNVRGAQVSLSCLAVPQEVCSFPTGILTP
jgi:hypothetical protein